MALYRMAALCGWAALALGAGHPYESDAPSDADVAAFVAWYSGWDAANAKIEVRDTMEWGLGVYATVDIKHRNKILHVPGEYVMTVDKALAQAAASGDRDTADGFRHIEKSKYVMHAWLIYERARGKKSKWHPWFRVLPREFHNPLHFTEDEVKHIEPKEVRLRVNEQRAEALKAFKILRHAIPQGDSHGRMTLEDVKWAMSVVATRSWHIGGKQYLVPVAGMFNHAPDHDDHAFDPKQGRQGPRSQKFLQYHKILEDGGAVVQSDRRVAAGEQAFESYGDNANSIYFEHHGFLQAGNPYDCITISFQKALDKYFTKATAHGKRLYDAGRHFNLPQKHCFHREEVPLAASLLHALAALPIDKLKCLDPLLAHHAPSAGAIQALYQCGGHEAAALEAFDASIAADLKQIYKHRSQEEEEKFHRGELVLEQRAATAVRHRATLRDIAHSVQGVLRARLRALDNEL